MIRLLLCTKDNEYVRRLSSYYNKEYRDRIEVNSVIDMEQAIAYIRSNDIDVALFDSIYEEIMPQAVSDKKLACFCAVLADKIYESDDGIKRIHKYQRADSLYKDILDSYASYGKVKVTHRTVSGNECKIYTFISPKGGSGTTTVAKAYARKKATYEKVLYMNLQPITAKSVTEVKEAGMDDIVMALKSRRNVLGIKLQSAVSKGNDQVDFYETCTNPMDLIELTKEDVEHLVKGIRELNLYQKVIFDIGDTITGREIELLKLADFNICVVDGEPGCVEKFERLYTLLDMLGKREKTAFLRKTEIFKNKWVRGLETLYEDCAVVKSGWAPHISDKNFEGIIERIAHSDSFDNLGISHGE